MRTKKKKNVGEGLTIKYRCDLQYFYTDNDLIIKSLMEEDRGIHSPEHCDVKNNSKVNTKSIIVYIIGFSFVFAKI